MAQCLAPLLSDQGETGMLDPRRPQDGEVLTVTQDECDSVHSVPVATMRRLDLGIMVLSSTCKVLYANTAAHRFLKRLNRGENGHSTAGAFPASVADLLDEILKSFETGPAKRDREQLEERRLVVGQDQALLLQAFSIPDRMNEQRSRIVLTIQEIALPVEP